jgi:hypothetical protein
MNDILNELVVTVIIIILVIAAFAVAGQRDDLKQEAVDRGFAEWVIKGQNKTEFKWKEKQ